MTPMWLLVTIAGAAAAIGLLALIGLALPRKHVVSRKARFRASPEALWRAIDDVASFPSWRKDITSVEVLPDREGRPRWLETSRFGKITFERVEAVEPRRLVIRIADEGLPFGGRWIHEIEGTEDGTFLAITEEGEIRNPIFRLLSRLMGQAATIERFLKALGERLEEQADAGRRPAGGDGSR